MPKLKRYPRRPSPAIVVACLALLVATAGSAQAVMVDQSGLSGTIKRVRGEVAAIKPGGVNDSTARCGAGYTMLSGGYDVDGSPNIYVTASFGTSDFWIVQGVSPVLGRRATIQAYGYCVRVGTPVVP